VTSNALAPELRLDHVAVVAAVNRLSQYSLVRMFALADGSLQIRPTPENEIRLYTPRATYRERERERVCV
jgi:hypothetical protein